MKRILGIVASQRRVGNSEILTKVAMEAAGAGNQLELVRLTDLDLKPCKACYSCLPPDVPCHIKDDLNFLLDLIKSADAVVIAAPCYFLGPQGSIKMLQDRFLSVVNKSKDFAGKPCVTITTYGVADWEGYTQVALNLTARFLNLRLLDSASFLGANPGEVLENPQYLEKARQLGRSLVDPLFQRSSKANECPVCWSDLFRYNGKDIICLFCGTHGEMKVENGQPKVVFNPQANHRFSEEGLRHHFNVFLNSKKQEFIEKRKYYKELQAPYQSMDWWVENK